MRPAFLDRADNGIEKKDDADDEAIDFFADQEDGNGGEKQDVDDRALELAHENQKKAVNFRFRKLVRSEFFQSAFRLSFGQAVFAGVEILENVFNVKRVDFFHDVRFIFSSYIIT